MARASGLGGMSFDSSSEAVEIIFVANRRIGGDNTGFPFGQWSPFVENDGIDVRGFFHRGGVFVADTALYGLAHADHDGGGGGETEGAGGKR